MGDSHNYLRKAFIIVNTFEEIELSNSELEMIDAIGGHWHGGHGWGFGRFGGFYDGVVAEPVLVSQPVVVAQPVQTVATVVQTVPVVTETTTTYTTTC